MSVRDLRQITRLKRRMSLIHHAMLGKRMLQLQSALGKTFMQNRLEK